MNDAKVEAIRMRAHHPLEYAPCDLFRLWPAGVYQSGRSNRQPGYKFENALVLNSQGALRSQFRRNKKRAGVDNLELAGGMILITWSHVFASVEKPVRL